MSRTVRPAAAGPEAGPRLPVSRRAQSAESLRLSASGTAQCTVTAAHLASRPRPAARPAATAAAAAAAAAARPRGQAATACHWQCRQSGDSGGAGITVVPGPGQLQPAAARAGCRTAAAASPARRRAAARGRSAGRRRGSATEIEPEGRAAALRP
jgi:hypothetical protein